MAFQIVQPFDEAEYSYDRAGDVLYVSFGPPAPAVALQIEDWLALRVCIPPQQPRLVGMTIVGFRKIFEKINRYIEDELRERIESLKNVSVSISYDDAIDTLIMRWAESSHSLTIFELLGNSVYLEKSFPSKDIVGVKIPEYTKCGPAAIEAFFGTIIDTIFGEQPRRDENANLLTNAFIQHLDRDRLAEFVAV